MVTPFLPPMNSATFSWACQYPLARDTGETVDASPYVCPVPVLELDLCRDHGFRRETRRCIVEIDNIAEDGKIPADRLHIIPSGSLCCHIRFHGSLFCYFNRFFPSRRRFCLQGIIVPHRDPPVPAEFPHLGRQRLPAPEPPFRVCVRKAPLFCVLREHRVPAPGIVRVHYLKVLILALEHGRADITPDPFDPLLVKGVHRGLLPPEVEEDFECPPVPDRGDVELERVSRVLAGLFERSPVPRLVPPVALHRDAGTNLRKVELERAQLQELAAPPVILPRGPGLLDRLPEVPGFFDHGNTLRFHKRDGLRKLDTGIEEERLRHPGLSCEREHRRAVLAT